MSCYPATRNSLKWFIYFGGGHTNSEQTKNNHNCALEQSGARAESKQNNNSTIDNNQKWAPWFRIQRGTLDGGELYYLIWFIYDFSFI